MDDSCAVCAESLEWVAYGACGHKDVCSTCVARLRFICDDRRCCICKTESDVVFVTKALGDYTKKISDFSIFPSKAKEGKMEQYWYHEDTGSFFDDLDHYKMIKAMCKLSCGVCDKMEDRPDDGSRRKTELRNIEQLKAHLFHKHRLMMCSLCLEGRKVFICEQKLYTRAQLTQHINTGDSEVDGTESERGGFLGHPRCEFCGTPFYGDNELYTHMSTEHFICHICQRQHPGQYEYYKNYDDLEIHFRRDHFLCEEETCLVQKFIVFQSESELKRHNTLEHGGRMPRSKRNAALQIPTSFRYHRSDEQVHHRGRGRPFQRSHSNDQISLAIQASLETANAAPSETWNASDNREITDVDSLVLPLESLGNTDSEKTSRYLKALSNNTGNATLGEISFPPLPVNPGTSQLNPHPDSLPRKTMAAHLRSQSDHKKHSSRSAGNRQLAQPESISSNAWPLINGASGSTSGSGMSRPATETGNSLDSSFIGSLTASRLPGSTSRISHSLSASNLSDHGSLDSSISDFPPVSAAQRRNSPAIDHPVVKVNDVQSANKSLVEKIRSALEFDEDKFTAFKDISSEYRQGSMDAETYLTYALEFSLSHLIPELALLLPNPQRRKELMEAYLTNMVHTAPTKNSLDNGRRSNGSKKGKGKSIDPGNSIADKVISSVKELQSTYRDSGESATVLSKNGYRFDRGKAKVVDDDPRQVFTGPSESPKLKSMESDVVEDTKKKPGNDNGKSKPRKKTSKFNRVRLGDGSIKALLDRKSSDLDPDRGSGTKDSNASNGEITGSSPARGVWRNGGGQKLFTVSKESRRVQ